MKMLMVGCEYAGTTTLAVEMSRWIDRVIGGAIHGGLAFHDHHKLLEGGHVGTKGVPENRPEDDEDNLGFSARHRQSYKHYTMSYHLAPTFFADPHHLMVGMHFDDEIYGPKYLGYGEDQADLLRKLSVHAEHKMLEYGPDLVLVLVKASPDVIRRRMKENPHPHPLVTEDNVEAILARFEELYGHSHLGTLARRFVLDTSASTVEETMAEFADQIKKRLSDTDRLRILSRRMLRLPTTV